MTYHLTAGTPSESATYAHLLERLREAQEDAAVLSHLTADAGRPRTSQGWLAISENLKRMQHIITEIATGKLS